MAQEQYVLPSALQELVDWESALIEQQAKSSHTFYSLPFELQQFIHIGLTLVHTKVDIPLSYLRRIYHFFGPSGRRTATLLQISDFVARPDRPEDYNLDIGRLDPTQPKTIGHKRRALLAILTVEYAIPIWNARFRSGPTVLLSLARARKVLINPQFELPSDWCVYADPDIFPPSDWVRFAAAHCIDIVREDVSLGGNNTYDVVRLIAESIRNHYRLHPKQQEACTKFWQWWLTTAIPSAWYMGSQAG